MIGRDVCDQKWSMYLSNYILFSWDLSKRTYDSRVLDWWLIIRPCPTICSCLFQFVQHSKVHKYIQPHFFVLSASMTSQWSEFMSIQIIISFVRFFCLDEIYSLIQRTCDSFEFVVRLIKDWKHDHLSHVTWTRL